MQNETMMMGAQGANKVQEATTSTAIQAAGQEPDRILSREGFVQWRDGFKKLARAKEGRKEDFLLRSALVGRSLSRSGFTPIANPKKIGANGNNKWFALDEAIRTLENLLGDDAKASWRAKARKEAETRWGFEFSPSEREALLVQLKKLSGERDA